MYRIVAEGIAYTIAIEIFKKDAEIAVEAAYEISQIAALIYEEITEKISRSLAE